MMITALVIAASQGVSGVGMGLQLGWPTAFNLRVWRGSGFTPQVIGGLNSGRWHIGLDLQKAFFLPGSGFYLSGLLGSGLSVEQSEHGPPGAWLGVPAMGAEMVFTGVPLGIFAGFSPVLRVSSEHPWDIQMGFGLRYTVMNSPEEPAEETGKEQNISKNRKPKPKPKPEPESKSEVDQKTIKTLYLKGLDAYTKQDYKTAIYYWNKVLELDPDNEKAKQGIKRAKQYLGE